MADTTRLIRDWRAGDAEAFDQLFSHLYDELKLIARQRMSSQRRGQTLATTVLVHEVYVKLVESEDPTASDRAHFLAIASRAMRYVLVDAARARGAMKRGSGVPAVPIDEVQVASGSQAADEILQLHEALERLAAFDTRLARVVECRFFGGMEYPEISEALGISIPTAKRDWAKARGWLYEFMRDEDGTSP